MIRLLENFDGSGLGSTHYSRLIRSHLAAYGAEFPFCSFYEICSKKRLGIISLFNGAMTADLCEGSRAGSAMRREIAEFIDFQRPASAELPAELVAKSGFSGYTPTERRFFEIPPGETSEGLISPEFETAFRAIGLPEESLPLWLTDTARRVNRGLGELLGYESSVLTVRFKEAGLAFISDLATPPEDRGKGYAGELLKRAAARLKNDGYISYLAARPGLWGFYEKRGCRAVGSDFIYISD